MPGRTVTRRSSGAGYFNTFVEQCIAIDKPRKKHFPTSNPTWHLCSTLIPGMTRTRKTASLTRRARSSLTTTTTYPKISHPIIPTIPRPHTMYPHPRPPPQMKTTTTTFKYVSAIPPLQTLTLLLVLTLAATQQQRFHHVLSAWAWQQRFHHALPKHRQGIGHHSLNCPNGPQNKDGRR